MKRSGARKERTRQTNRSGGTDTDTIQASQHATFHPPDWIGLADTPLELYGAPFLSGPQGILREAGPGSPFSSVRNCRIGRPTQISDRRKKQGYPFDFVNGLEGSCIHLELMRDRVAQFSIYIDDLKYKNLETSSCLDIGVPDKSVERRMRHATELVLGRKHQPSLGGASFPLDEEERCANE